MNEHMLDAIEIVVRSLVQEDQTQGNDRCRACEESEDRLCTYHMGYEDGAVRALRLTAD